MIATTAGLDLNLVQSGHKDWDAYVQRHPKGSIFHTSAMIRAFAATRGIQPFAYAATDASGKIVAMLVSCHVKTLNQFAAMSSRAVQFAEPICDANSTGVAALIQLLTLHDEHMRSRALLSEVRTLQESGAEKNALSDCGYEHRDYINFVVDLQKDTGLLWGSLHKRMRQKIRSTLRRGVIMREDKSADGIKRLYKLLQASYSRARVPLLGRDLFENTLDHLPEDRVRLVTAFQNNEPIASIISLLFGNRIFSWYGGTLRLNGLSPFACLVWNDIVWASENGFSLYDFGGAGWPHEDYGPRKFKASFGGREVRYGRYILTYSKLRLSVAELAYQVSRRLGAWS